MDRDLKNALQRRRHEGITGSKDKDGDGGNSSSSSKPRRRHKTGTSDEGTVNSTGTLESSDSKLSHRSSKRPGQSASTASLASRDSKDGGSSRQRRKGERRARKKHTSSGSVASSGSSSRRKKRSGADDGDEEGDSKSRDMSHDSDVDEEVTEGAEDPSHSHSGSRTDFTAAFGDADFTAAFPTTKTTNTPSNDASGFAAFDSMAFADFGGDASGVGFAAFDATTSADSHQPHAFDFPKPSKVYDKSPLKTTPKMPSQKCFRLLDPPIHCASFNFNSSPAPVANPLNGNIIAVQHRQNGDKYLCEINSKTGAQVVSMPLLDRDLQKKIAQRYSVTVAAIEHVLVTSIGVHSAQNASRARVACLMDLLVVDSSEVLRAICIYSIGYGGATRPLSLLTVLSPPSGNDFTYDPQSLLVADSCVFVSGASSKGPCVFLCKHTVKETWSANFVGKDSTRITAMDVTTGTDRVTPYLAIALTDGTLSVWTYAAAVQMTSKTADSFRRLLFPLCRLEGTKILSRCAPTKYSSKDVDIHETSKDIGHCTWMQWAAPRPALTGMTMLVAGFQGGVSLYHVELPAIESKNGGQLEPVTSPSQTTQLSQTPNLKPFSLARWPAVHESSCVSWLDLGPHAPPAISIVLNGLPKNRDYTRLLVCSANIPQYSESMEATVMAPLQILGTREWKSPTKLVPKGLIHCASLPGVAFYSEDAIYTLRVSNIGRQICSTPTGLMSNGTVYLADSTLDRQGVLHVFTNWYCVRKQVSQDFWEWSTPSRRHWLCQTVAGDTKESSLLCKSKESEGEVFGGAKSKLLCELGGVESLSNLVPDRIVRSGNYSALIFRDFNNMICQSVAMIETVSEDSKARIVQVMEGRDFTFFPPDDNTKPQLALLLQSAGKVTFCLRQTDKESKTLWQMGESCRPILGVDEDEETFIDCRRLIIRKCQDNLRVIAVGTKKSDGRNCIIAGASAGISDEDAESKWTMILPNAEESPTFWLEDSEHTSCLLSLPNDGSTEGGIAVATNRRVLILSPTMKVLGETKIGVSPSALTPIGSYSVTFCSEDYGVRYVSGLEVPYGTGLVASLPMSHHTYCPFLLIAARQDRLIYYEWHCGSRLAEKGDDRDAFKLPIAMTRPALLLEPMIANAISTYGTDLRTMPLLRTIVEKFGRKVATMTHAEDEGIGNMGAGLTPKALALLSHYGIHEAASWLLTGALQFDRAANSRILPPWMPVAAKSMAALDSDLKLHVLANGDQYFSEYAKSPETNMISTLPRPSDPSAIYSKDFALQAFKEGDAVDFLKLLDVAGNGNSDSLILQMSLALQSDPFQDMSAILGAFRGDSQLGKTSISSANASLAALALRLKSGKIGQGREAQESFAKQSLKKLAPSFQKGKKTSRERQRLIDESAFSKIGPKKKFSEESALFSTDFSEMKHVWNEGPNKEKENLLMLDEVRDWFGRRCPVVLGKEGARSAEDRGASTLADILNKGDDDSFGAENEDDFKDGWIDGVGEGQKDEDKLSSYFRFSEGDEEDETDWKVDGFSDLSKFENKAFVVGGPDIVHLEESKSSVDEGEPGKVKALFDLVFSDNGVGQGTGLSIAAPRGSSLDVGLFHGPEHDSRQKCTVEFWFWVPEKIESEIVLIRRTFGASAGDLDRVCLASERDSVLWEVALLLNGEVEIRTASGLKSKSEPIQTSDDNTPPVSSVSFSKWNHISVTFRQSSTTSSHVKLYLKGKEKISSVLDFSSPEIEIDDFAGASALDGILDKSHMLFGLDHPFGYRMTELRVWAMERAQEDIETFMTEYLECAETKRKLRVAIKKKGGEAKGKVGNLVAPGGLLKPPASLAPPKSMLAPPGGIKPPNESTKPSSKKIGLLAPPRDEKDQDYQSPDIISPPAPTPSGFGSENDNIFAGFDPSPQKSKETPIAPSFKDTTTTSPLTESHEVQQPSVDEFGLSEEAPEISPLWDSAIPLSEQVRSSAAAALIRGPPATRHFGGNRGGLPDYRELERFGVGAISICGSEKTIVWRDDQVPPGLTYPIGASGAVVSDQMDEEGSEFLCCFLAKDKRMVVFELSTRTVVVELQMTTKLNYWRFLPPEAGEDTLCFMLVTPVGGFHWMPLDESPRPRQVWKRGQELQGKKIVSYEEGGTNGLDGQDMLSKAGLLQVTNTSTGGRLEAWIVPICGDSQAVCASDDVLGACLCTPPEIGYEAWMPLLLFVVSEKEDLRLCVSAITEAGELSVGLTDVMTDTVIEMAEYAKLDYAPPTLAMGTWPEVLCCSLGSTIVVIHRRKGLVVAYELGEGGLELIAQECVGHFVVDAVMRYSAVEGGAEIVLLMSDDKNLRDGRVGTFCFRSAV